MIFMEDNIFDLKEKVSLLNKELNKKDIRINEQDKEIERLTAESTEWESKFYDLQERFDNLMEAHKICDVDNERLNNIINNLEYWLKMEWTYNADVNEQYEEAIENTLDRLKSLKEGK